MAIGFNNRNRRLISCLLALLPVLFLDCVGGKPPPIDLTPAPDPMPVPGRPALLRVALPAIPGVLQFQWLKDGQAIPGATGNNLTFHPVAYTDAGVYQFRVTYQGQTLLTPAWILEPADRHLVVQTTADSGPGSLREALNQANLMAGRVGIQFNLPVAGHAPVIHLLSDLPPLSADICILGPGNLGGPVTQLTIDGGNAHRPFFVAGGHLILDNLTVANGLGKGGDSPGGGGGAAGMGGAMFINRGAVELRRVTFRGNVAQGGNSGPGSDGEDGGGAGFGGDSPVLGGGGGPGGFLLGAGGDGVLDGHLAQGWSGGADGAGGGAIRGGPLSTSLAQWVSDREGGRGSWSGGGGFSVGPIGGGGQGSGFGGGGGGAGGRVFGTVLEGGSTSFGGIFGGMGGLGDGILPARGGGGGGLGGAIFLRSGSLAMLACDFLDNHARPGLGFESGLGKGGAIFIYQFRFGVPQPAFDLTVLNAQTFNGNSATDAGLEDPSYDNPNFYAAQDILFRGKSQALELLLQRYRQSRKLGLPWTPEVLAPDVQ